MKLSTLVTFVAVSAVSTAAFAQQPYSPKKLSPSDVIQPATYERVPIRLPNYEVTSTRSVVDGNRLDFEQSYNVDFWDLIEFFESSYKERKPVSVLDPAVFPNANAPDLIVYGKHNTGGVANFTLGHPSLPYRFNLIVRSDDQSKAVVVIKNAVFSLIYSGLMPARAGFKPAGKTDEIPFRWN